MAIENNKEEYIRYYNTILKENSKLKKRETLEAYFEKNLTQLEKLIEGISKDNFWQVTPLILGIDAKMNIVSELIRFSDLSEVDMINIAENDYTTYFQELCGYNLSAEEKISIIFNVS